MQELIRVHHASAIPMHYLWVAIALGCILFCIGLFFFFFDRK